MAGQKLQQELQCLHKLTGQGAWSAQEAVYGFAAEEKACCTYKAFACGHLQFRQIKNSRPPLQWKTCLWSLLLMLPAGTSILSSELAGKIFLQLGRQAVIQAVA